MIQPQGVLLDDVVLTGSLVVDGGATGTGTVVDWVAVAVVTMIAGLVVVGPGAVVVTSVVVASVVVESATVRVRVGCD
jgi:hypothetical protein